MKKLLLTALGLTALVIGAGGCQVPAAFAYKVLGPPPEPAKFTPAQEPMLVLVENTHSASATIPEADELSTTVREELATHEVAPMVEPQKIHELRDKNPLSFGRLSISDIGRRVGARQVLYINVRELELDTPTGSDVVRLKLAASIKVVDTQSARNLWPGDEEGEPFGYTSPVMRITPEMSAAFLKRQSLRTCGIEIAKMFYKHQAETLREENKDMKLR